MKELTITPEPIHEYCKTHSSQPSSDLQQLIPITEKLAPHVAHMQVGNLEGNFLAILLRLMNAKNVVEFGTFTGYSALAMAEALPENGKVTTLDRDPRATAIAQEHWGKSNHSGKIELLLGDARLTCAQLEEEIKSGSRTEFDLSFIDADKSGYDFYFESSLKLVRKGGAIIADNVLWSGSVLEPKEKSDLTIDQFNKKIASDPRILKVMLPVRDGITVMIKL
jgi:caffeoyl-CoA O-methyltransferase